MTHIKAIDHTIYFEDERFSELKRFLKDHPFHSYVVLCDENTLSNCLPLLIRKVPALKEAEVIEVESGEDSKAIEIATHIWRTLAELNADRSTLFINLGGGVITDLGGFCASIYKRGIPFIHIPTSLLAMADASVGGKTAIDLDHLKNLVGTISQPRAVFISPAFLTTLPERHLKNGLAEIYKIALVKDKTLWSKINDLSTEELIARAVKNKSQIVSRDPFDKGLRKILNFGHTIGHAIESVSLAQGKDILHGEAVVAGMLIEAWLSKSKKLLAKKEYEEIVKALKFSFSQLSIAGLNREDIQRVMANDKKNTRGSVNFSLLSGIGSCVWDQKVDWSLCEQAFDEYNDLING